MNGVPKVCTTHTPRHPPVSVLDAAARRARLARDELQACSAAWCQTTICAATPRRYWIDRITRGFGINLLWNIGGTLPYHWAGTGWRLIPGARHQPGLLNPDLTTTAGMPTAIEPGGTLFNTTELAPIAA